MKISIVNSGSKRLTLWQPVPNIFGFYYHHIEYLILNMLKIKCDIKSARFEKSWPPFCQIWIIFTENPQLQASENSNWIIWRLTWLTLVLLNCFKLFSIHLKLELLTQFPDSNDEKKSPKLKYLINWASTTEYFINFSGILFRLKLSWKRIYPGPAGQGLKGLNSKSHFTCGGWKWLEMVLTK